MIRQGLPAGSANESIEAGRSKSLLGYAFALAGKRGEARKLLDELRQTSAQPHYIAQIYIGLNEPDRAIEWLEKAYPEKSGDLIFLKTDPIYRCLDSNPRFSALLQRIDSSSAS